MAKKIICQGNLSFNYIYFVLFIISMSLAFYIESYFTENNSELNFFKEKIKNKDNNYLPSQILNLYIINISDFIAIIPYFIRNKLIKKKKKISQIIQARIDKDSNKKKKTIIIYFIIISIFDFLSKFGKLLYSLVYPNKINSLNRLSCIVPFEIVLQFICSYLILKIHFYKLQYFSLFLNLGIFIIILHFTLLLPYIISL